MYIKNDMNEDLPYISNSYTYDELFNLRECYKLLIRISYSQYQKELNNNKKKNR